MQSTTAVEIKSLMRPSVHEHSKAAPSAKDSVHEGNIPYRTATFCTGGKVLCSILFFGAYRRENAVFEPIAFRKLTHEKDSSVSDAMLTPATTGSSVAYTCCVCVCAYV
jgi:hypothetical protein